MRFARALALLSCGVVATGSGVAACSSSPEHAKTPPARQSTKETLASFCASSPCTPFQTQREAATSACSTPTSAITHREGKCGAFDVLIEDSDLVTSSRYYDASAKLVAVRVFSHEWGNRTDFGPIPECALGALVDVCHYRGGAIAPAPSTATPTPTAAQTSTASPAPGAPAAP